MNLTIIGSVDSYRDPITDTDWAAHWRRLVESREAQAGERDPREDFWSGRAARFAARPRSSPDAAVAALLVPWLGPRKTLVDVGAGTGRYSTPLAERLDWVTAVEPSQGMRDRIPHADNMTVIGSGWLDAEVAAADLAICFHVLYTVREPVPFIEKLEASAHERVFILLRDGGHPHPADLFAGSAWTREPGLRDCFELLRQLGIAPALEMFTYHESHRYGDLEEAAAECRETLGRLWDDDRGRAWLAAELHQDEDGSWVHPGGQVAAGVLHWKPRS
jgi:SAM-dependent methyltransferase